MPDHRSIDRVLQNVPPTETIIDRSPHALEIREALVRWAQSPVSDRPTFRQLSQEIVDTYAQDGSLGNAEGNLRNFLNTHIAGKLVLSRAFMNAPFIEAGTNRNLLQQHYKTLEIIDSALEGARIKVETSAEGEGVGNLLALLGQRETVLKNIRELEMILGNLEDQRVQKSVNMRIDGQIDSEGALSIMEQTRKRRPIIDVAKRDAPEP